MNDYCKREQLIRTNYKQLTYLLIKKGLTITTMESATSGQIASLITDTEGASAVLRGAYITYSNEAKIQCGVPKEIIDQYSVYSLHTAHAMAEAAKEAYHANIAVGVTGTMGNIDPENECASTPGEVYISVITDDDEVTERYKLDPQESRLMYKLEVAEIVYLILSDMLK